MEEQRTGIPLADGLSCTTPRCAAASSLWDADGHWLTPAMVELVTPLVNARSGPQSAAWARGILVAAPRWRDLESCPSAKAWLRWRAQQHMPMFSLRTSDRRDQVSRITSRYLVVAYPQ